MYYNDVQFSMSVRIGILAFKGAKQESSGQCLTDMVHASYEDPSVLAVQNIHILFTCKPFSIKPIALLALLVKA
jgi:hypothetical protein